MLLLSFFADGLYAQNILLVKEINTTSGGSSAPRNFTVCNNKLFFADSDNTNIAKLWVTTGTGAITQLLGFSSGVGNSISNRASYNTQLFFAFEDSVMVQNYGPATARQPEQYCLKIFPPGHWDHRRNRCR